MVSSLPIDEFLAYLPGALFRYRVLADGSDRIDNMSAGCFDIWELSASDIEGDPSRLWGMVDARDLPAFAEAVAQSGRDLTDWVFQWRVTTPSGRRKWLHGVGRPIREADGGLLWHSFILDITDSLQAREAELASERRFGSLLDAAPNLAVQGYDDELVCRYWNAASEQLYGWSREEAIGRSLLDLMIPAVMHDDVRAATRTMLDTGEAIPSGELELIRRDGSPVRVYSSHVYLKGEGKRDEFFCIDQDLTERYQAEAVRSHLEGRLRESQKMEALGTLAGGVAHDFNNIVAAILGNVELALADASPEAQSAVSLREIRKAGRRARDLVQQILTFSRRQDNTRAVTDVRALLHEAEGMLRTASSSEVELLVDAGSGLPVIWANATQIQQVLLNLVTNALQAALGRVGGQVRVSLRSCEGEPSEGAPDEIEVLPVGPDWPGIGVCIQVSDNGDGMAPQTLARIFEPFFTTKATGSGTGLGLAVVHGILREHHAALRVRSAPGQGTTFTVQLPGMAGTETADGPVEEDNIAVGHTVSAAATVPHILYVDDDESMAFLIHRWLERNGYRVTTCGSAEQALERLEASGSAFTLCITDYNMPGMSGLTLAREIKSRWSMLPIAIASGYISDELRQQAPEAGVDELVYKPDTVEELCRTIERLLKRKSAG
jgi:PAS domain S-box-containing protein